jgi:hypothetical protein
MANFFYLGIGDVFKADLSTPDCSMLFTTVGRNPFLWLLTRRRVLTNTDESPKAARSLNITDG